MKICGIYELKCKSDGKFLIGSSNHIMRRYSQHLWDLRRNIHHNPHLQSAFSLYGEPSFEIKVLEECDEKDLLTREDRWIFERNALDPKCGFNFKPAFRPVHNEETCKKLSDGKMGDKNPMYGKRLSEEHRRKIGESSRIHMLGRHPSIETKQKMSKSQTGKKLSEATKAAIGRASCGRIKSEETREKLSQSQRGEKAWMYGKHHSEETKRKISKGNIGKKHTEEAKRKISESQSGEKNVNFGKHLSEEHKSKISQSNIGRQHSAETKAKISMSHKGKIVTEEARIKMSKAKIGKHLSEEHKRKLSDILKGRVVSEEAKRKISESHRGKRLSDEHKKKLSESHKGKVRSDETKRKISMGLLGNKNQIGLKVSEKEVEDEK